MRLTSEVLGSLSNGLELAWSPSVSGPSGLRALDLSGKQRHGTLGGVIDPTSAWISRDCGATLNFDGVDDRVSFPSAGLQITGPITISCWLVIRNNGGFATILSKGDSNVNEFELAADFRSGATVLAWRPGAGTSFNSFFAGHTDKWVHVTVTCSGAAANASIAAFRNGNSVGMPITATTARTVTNNNLTIGLRPSVSNPGAFQMDDLRIYSRVLSATEIQALATERGVGLRLWERPRRRSRFVPSGDIPLGATGLSTGSPTVGSPAVTQTHVLTGTGLSTGSPTVGSPAVAQTHVLTGTGLSTGSPTVGSPAVAQTHVLTGTGLSTGSPTVGSPAVAQTHVLTGTGLSTGSPTVGSPSLALAGTLLPNGLSTGSPTVGSPAVAQTHVLTGTGLSTGSPTVGSPAVAQTHVLTGTGLSTGSPTVGSPALSLAGTLSPNGLSTGSPTVGSPAVAQTHVLTGTGLSTGSPTVGSPALTGPATPTRLVSPFEQQVIA